MINSEKRNMIIALVFISFMLLPILGGFLNTAPTNPRAQFLLSAPTIDSPVDLTFENGTLGETIVWHPSDPNPSNYTVTRDGVVHKQGAWSGSSITVYLNHLYPEGFLDEPNEVPRTFVFVCTVFNEDEESASDEVLVNVIPDETAPDVKQPANITYEVGSFGHEILWNITETNPDFYNVSRYSNEPINNQSVIESGNWDGSNITVNVDGLNATRWYIYTLFVNDTLGHNTTSIVNVTVTFDLTPPTVISPGNILIEFGTLGEAVTWKAYDANPKNYSITVLIHYNNTFYGNLTNPLHAPANITSTTWEFTEPKGGSISVSLDNVYLGNYTFSILLFDDFDRNITDTINVTIYEDVRSPIIDGPESFSYEEGYTGHSLEWSAEETNPMYYNLTKDGDLIMSGIWRGENISTSVDGLAVGIYSYNISFIDFFNWTSFRVVELEVTPDAHLPLIQQVQPIQYFNTPTTNNLTVQAYVWDLNRIRNITVEWYVGDEESVTTIHMTLLENDFYSAPIGEFSHGAVVHFRVTATDNSSVNNVQETQLFVYTVTSLTFDILPPILTVVVLILGSLAVIIVLGLYFRTRTR